VSPPGSGFHGEVIQFYPSYTGDYGYPSVIGSVIFDFNVVNLPQTYYNCCTTIGPFVADFTASVTYFEEIFNFLVTNTSNGVGITPSDAVAAGMTEFGTNFVTRANVYGNYLDPTGVVVGTGSNRECLVVGAASNGLPGSISGTTLTIDGTWSLTTNGLIAPGGTLYNDGGTLGPTFPVVMPFSTPGTTGAGGAGNYILSVAATSNGPYTETAAVDSLNLGSGGSPASRGTNNWSLTSNSAITGYTISSGIGAQICS
jgi:hypothetical protein